MNTRTLRIGAPLLLAFALAVAGCGGGAKAAGSSASSAPSPTASPSATSKTVTLEGDTAAALGVDDGTKATVVPDPADAPAATEASQPSTAPGREDAYVQQLAEDTGLGIDPSAAPDPDWVTVKAGDEKLSMDVPAAWQFIKIGSGDDEAFGALSSSGTPDQFVLAGTRPANSMDDEVDELTRIAVDDAGCKAGPVRPYEDERFAGKGRSFVCPGDTSETFFVVDGKGETSSFKGAFNFKTRDALGVAAIKRAIETFEIS